MNHTSSPSERRGWLGRLLTWWGRLVTARPLLTVVVFGVVLGGLIGAAAVFGAQPRDDYNVTNVPAYAGGQLLEDHLPELTYATATVVVHDGPSGAVPASVINDLVATLRDVPHADTVAVVGTSTDGRTVAIDVRYDRAVTDPAIWGRLDLLEKSFTSTQEQGYAVDATGPLPLSAAQPFSGRGEVVGVVAAALVLLIGLGSVIAAGLSLVTAIGGLVAGGSLVLLLARVMSVSTVAPTVAAMVGLGVGLDYCLLLVVRLIEFRKAGLAPRAAAVAAVETAGRSVLFAGITVLLALSGLSLSGLPIFASFAYATALAVIAAVAAALTLVPCLGMLYARRLPDRPARAISVDEEGATGYAALTERWAKEIVRCPIASIIVALVILGSLALPALSMKSWPQDASNEPTSFTNRRAQDALASGLGEGFGATILAVASSTVSRSDVETFAANVTDVAHVKEVTPLGKSPDGKIIVLAITPTIRTADPGTPALVNDIRALAPDGVHITGDSPVNTDIADLLSRRLPLVMAFVIGSACILLGLIFRSVAIPIKAALMNLLSVAASYGAMQLVFHDGYGRELIGVDKQVPVSSYVLMLMFTILFGLSMDYEVFILSRIKEQFDLTGDPATSLTQGLADTAGVVTAAATVMVAVFAGFAAEGDIIVKQMGFGMAVAIFLDATLIRMLLVPAAMAVLGRWNWWPGAGRDRPKAGGEGTGIRFADKAGLSTASR